MLDLNYKPHFTNDPDFSRSESTTNTSIAMVNGKRYEAKALLEIGGRCALKGWKAQSGPWIKYKEENGGLRYCQPDVVISVKEDQLILVEIKLKHTRKAFPQLSLYKECLEAMLPCVSVTCLIWCKYFDPVEGVIPLVDDLFLNPDTTSALVWR